MDLNNLKESDCKQLLIDLENYKKVNPLWFYEHLPLQAKFHNDESRVKAIFGGNRSGKSCEGAEYLISKCLLKDKQRWWAVAETEEVSISIQQRKVWEILPKNKLKYAHYDEVNGFRNGKIVFKNGSMIRFKTYKQGREAFASDDIDGVWNDEESPYDIYREQRMRLIDRNGEMIFTMTSLNGITDLIQEIFEEHDVIESAYAPLVKKDLPRIIQKDNMRFYMLWTPENPYIDQNRLMDEVKLMTPDEIVCRIYGLPLNLSGRIYMKFTKKVHVISFDDVPDLSECTIYHVLDPHDRKPWAMIWVAVHKTGTHYVIDEYPNKNFNDMTYDDKTYDEYVKLIHVKEDQLMALGARGVYKRIIDPNFGNKTVQLAERQGGQSKTTPKEELRKRGLKFQDGIDALEAGHLKVREVIHYEVKDGQIIIQSQLLVCDNCENTIRHMLRYSRKDLTATDGDVKDKVGVLEKYKDFCDVIRYFEMSNPKHESMSDLPQEAPKTERKY